MAVNFQESFPIVQWNLNNHNIQKHYSGSKNDSGNGFKLQIFQGATPLTPSTETAYFYFTKSDGTSGYIEATISGDYFLFSATNQVYAVKGEVPCWFQLSDGTKWRTSHKFIINVDDNNIADAIASTNEFIALQDALNKVNNLEETYAPRLTQAETNIGNKSLLTTTDKASLVNAVNEVKAEVTAKANTDDVTNSLNLKVDKDGNKGLSTNDYDNTEKAEVAKVANKADKTYVDTQINTIGNASPKGVYTTLTALQTAFPTGTTGIYLVTADGKWYYWNGTAWTAGGTYQSTGIADKAVTAQKITDSVVQGINNNNGIVGWEIGSIYTDGTDLASTTRIRCSYVRILDGAIIGLTDYTNKKYAIILYNTNKTFISNLGFATSDRVLSGQYYARILVAYQDDRVVTDSDTLGNYAFIKDVVTNQRVTDDVIQTINSKDSVVGWEIGNIYTDGTDLASTQTIRSKYIPVNAGTAISLSDYSTYKMKVVVYNITNKAFKSYHAWLSEDFIITELCYVRIVIAYQVSADITDVTAVSRYARILDTTPMINELDAYVKAVAHRGYPTVAPENTLPSYILAKRKGFSYVEADLNYTSDGVLVLLHDDTIDRTSNGTGDIHSMTFANVRTYDFGSWKSANYAGTVIPSFEEFIILCKKLNLCAVVELKTNLTTAHVDAAYAIVKKLGMLKNVKWISFTLSLLNEIVTLDNTANVGLIFWTSMGTYANISDAVTAALTLKTVNNDVSVVSMDTVTQSSSDTVINAGLSLGFAVTSDSTVINEMVNYGVTEITVDSVNVAQILFNSAH